MAEAQEKLKCLPGFFGQPLGGGSPMVEALELFMKAARCYQEANTWKAAGSALNLRNGYKSGDPRHIAINAHLQMIDSNKNMGRFKQVAKHHMTIAEIYETELGDIEKGVVHIEQAADYYKSEGSYTRVHRCLLMVARLSIQIENYQKAIYIYESVANASIESPLLKYSAKDYYFRAALCHMCIDVLNAQLAIKKYEEMYPQFGDSRECKLVKRLLERLEDNDSDGFTEVVKDYDSISRLDQWFTNILLKIKKQMKAIGMK